MNQLLSDNLWPTLAKLSDGHRRILAAISYVTTAAYLKFGEGDTLVCDASDAAIKAGMTSAKALRRFAAEGAKVFSFDGLHAKALLIDDKAIIGSANLSENAGVNTCEASLVTTSPQVAAMVRGFVEQARRVAVPVNEAFLRRIEVLPVVRTGGGRGRRAKRISSTESRLWMIPTRPLHERVSRAEATAERSGMAQAKKRLKRGDYEINQIRWSGKSRFRSNAKPGDLVIEVFRQKRGKRTFTEVYRAAPIIHRQDAPKWTRFYLERPLDESVYYVWSELKSDFARLGLKNISPKSTRELTQHAPQVLACFN